MHPHRQKMELILVDATPRLRRCAELAALSEAEVYELVRDGPRAVRYARGDKIVEQGDEGDSMFVVLAGNVVKAVRVEHIRLTLG